MPAPPSHQISPTWGVRWVAGFTAVFLAGVVGLAMLASMGRGPGWLGKEWEGRRAAIEQLRMAPDVPFLLGPYEAPHLDEPTGLPVALFADGTDRAFSAGWNLEMRARAAQLGASRRYDGADTDGRAILRRLDDSGDRVVEWREPASRWTRDAPEWAVTVDGVRLEFGRSSNCSAYDEIRVRGRAVPYVGPEDFCIRATTTAGGTRHGVPWPLRWLPGRGAFRALASDDRSIVWLAGPAGPPEIAEGRTGWWTATIDVERAVVVAVDLVTED